ncbi:MAG: hypothetical protein ACLP7J_07025 [Streptosporangiaceae bacterium]
MSSSYYEIRVAGVLPPDALAGYDQLTARIQRVQTILRGPLSDQAALGRLLAWLELLGARPEEIRLLLGAGRPAVGDQACAS